MSVLSVENLCFSYSDRDVLKNISFNVTEGEILVVLGQNGSGKTTLLKCAVGILNPNKGKVKIDNLEIANLTLRERAKLISYLPQEDAMNFSYRVIDVVLMGRAPYISIIGKPTFTDMRFAMKSLEMLNVRHLATKIYSSLSGGEKKLVSLARVLVQKAKILVLDEPTNHLDFKNQYMFLKRIRDIVKSENICAVVSLHNPNLASFLANKILMLKDGKVIGYGMTKEMLTENNLSNLYETDVLVKTQGKISMVMPQIL